MSELHLIGIVCVLSNLAWAWMHHRAMMRWIDEIEKAREQLLAKSLADLRHEEEERELRVKVTPRADAEQPWTPDPTEIDHDGVTGLPIFIPPVDETGGNGRWT